MSVRRKITQPKTTPDQKQINKINQRLVKLQADITRYHSRLFRTTNKLRKLLFTEARLLSLRRSIHENN